MRIKLRIFVFMLIIPFMMGDVFAQNDGFFYEGVETRDINSGGYSSYGMSSGGDGFFFGLLGDNNGLGIYFNDIENGGNGMGFNDLDLSPDDVALGNGMLLLTGIGLAYLQMRRNKKENKN